VNIKATWSASTTELKGGQKGSWWELSLKVLGQKSNEKQAPMTKDNHIYILNCKNPGGKAWRGKPQNN
jgi:hypothetical protein